MIQFNLLPDIKIQYLKARRQKHLVLLSSIALIGVSLVVLGLLITTVFVVQHKSIADLSGDISTTSKQLEETKDLNKMLTVQNQLSALTNLHDKKAVAGRMFTYISQSTPASVSISRLNIDFGLQTLTISGAADSLETINVFTDTLKFTTFHTTADKKTEKRAFADVVLSSFGRDSQGASYTITFKFDSTIFSEADEASLTVPKRITTRSETEQPSALFQKSDPDTGEGQ